MSAPANKQADYCDHIYQVQQPGPKQVKNDYKIRLGKNRHGAMPLPMATWSLQSLGAEEPASAPEDPQQRIPVERVEF